MAARGYRSTLRREQAARTRERILDAARELFTEDGFGATTISAIAERAGVAAPTVYATLGSKAAIVQALLERLEDDADDPSVSRDAVAAETDPRRKLALTARWHRNLYSTGRTVLAAADEARGDPAVRTMRAEGDRVARQWHDALVTTLLDAGALRADLDREKAVDIIWALGGPDLYLRLAGTCGWSDDAYEAFLTDLLSTQLLDDPSGA